MSEPTLLFHDYETWGVSPAVDRPSQFAAIRTNLNLEIVGEPINWLCKPTADMLPHPEAAQITRMSPLTCLRKGMIEPEFFKKIHAEMSQPNTCTLGYNSIRFDDEVTRYGLYRNFYDPYEREYKDGNSRWDLIDIVRTAWALRPEGIEWPKREDGRVSFKLEDLSVANGIEHINAHDALSDVYATIDMARVIRSAQPKLFDYLFQNRQKNALMKMIDLDQRKPVLHVSGRISQDSRHCALMMPLMPHPTNKSGVIMLDLMQSPDEYAKLSAQEISDRIYRKQEELDAEGLTRPRIKVVYLNKSPVLLPATMLGEPEQAATGIDLERCRAHWQQLQTQAGALIAELDQMYSQPFEAKYTDPETKLYGGFLTPADKANCKRLHQLSAEQLASGTLIFDDERYEGLLLRYLGRHYPEVLNESQQRSWQSICYDRIMSDQYGPSPEDYLAKVEAMATSGDVNLQALARDLYQWGQQVLNV